MNSADGNPSSVAEEADPLPGTAGSGSRAVTARPLRILFTSLALPAHIRPHEPLARALLGRGHDVRLATAASMERLVTRSYGIPHLPAGLDWTADPDIERRLTSALARVGNEAFCRVLYGEVLAGQCVLPMFEDLLEHARHWAPDVVVNDCAEWAGPLLALSLGIRNLSADNGLLRNVWDHHADHIRPRLTEHRSVLGLGPEPRTPSSLDHVVLTPAPRELFLADLPIPAVQPYRHENPRQAREALPRWVRELPDDTPLVYVMLGSSGNCAPGMAAGFHRANRTVLEALAGFDGAVIVAVGRGNVSQYLPQPSHVRVVEYAPQTLVLRRANVFVTHCGFGGSREAIEAETPMVMLPWFADQPLNGREMAARGMGLLLDRSTATPSQVRDAIFEVLAETRYRAAISAVRRRMMALPKLEEIVGDRAQFNGIACVAARERVVRTSAGSAGNARR